MSGYRFRGWRPLLWRGAVSQPVTPTVSATHGILGVYMRSIFCMLSSKNSAERRTAHQCA
eukprot:4239501-Amphidinium_carterae.3